MRAVGLKVLKNRLSEYVRAAAAGETVLVTDRGRVVAELVPPQARSSSVEAEDRFADAVRAGWITPARRPSRDVPPSAPIMSFEALMEELDRDRADR